MDSSTTVEQKQIQLNQIETIYQEGVIRLISRLKVDEKIFIIFFQNNRKSLFFSLNSEKFLREHLEKIPFSFFLIYQIHSWVFFWLTNALDLNKVQMGLNIMDNIKRNLKFILFRRGQKLKNSSNCPNLISLYASTLSFFSIAQLSLKILKKDKIKIYCFLKKLNMLDAVFRCSFMGESDPRTIYCTLIVATLFNISTKHLIKKIDVTIEKINTFDGGFGCDKSSESHGALGFCLLGSCIFFSTKQNSLLIPPNIKTWFFEKLQIFDFGMQGRSAKLIDSCYFFWLGASAIIISFFMPYEFINVLIFCLDVFFKGFCDQIGKIPDLYHTCYSLAGLSLFTFFKKRKKAVYSGMVCKEIPQEFSTKTKINPIYGIKEAKFFFTFDL